MGGRKPKHPEEAFLSTFLLFLLRSVIQCQKCKLKSLSQVFSINSLGVQNGNLRIYISSFSNTSLIHVAPVFFSTNVNLGWLTAFVKIQIWLGYSFIFPHCQTLNLLHHTSRLQFQSVISHCLVYNQACNSTPMTWPAVLATVIWSNVVTCQWISCISTRPWTISSYFYDDIHAA